MADQHTQKSFSNQFVNYKPIEFGQYLSDFAPALQRELVKILENTRICSEDNKHVDVDKYLYEPLREYLGNTGKMHRPLTLIAAYLACGGAIDKIDDVVAVALALEIFQAGALIHDDIADESTMRRGKPCLHQSNGVPIALNCGDLCITMVKGNLLLSGFNGRPNYPADKLLRILRELTYMEYMTIEGQAMDLGWSRDKRYDLTESDYLAMATKKTAYYSASVPCALGAICADASLDTVKQMRSFGQKVGLGFQIQDDVINLVGSDKAKDYRSDIVEGKKTLVAVYALQNSSACKAKQLQDILDSPQNSDEQLQMAVDIMTECGAIEHATTQAKLLITQACESLQNLDGRNQWKDLLLDMSNWAISRSK